MSILCDRPRMHVTFEGEITLSDPSTDAGFLTWIQAKIFHTVAEEEGSQQIGSVRVALIHVDDACEAGELYDALDADSSTLEGLYDVFFDEAGLKGEFSEGAGEDLMYFETIDLAPEWQGRDLELLVVRRLIDALGHGAELVVLPYQGQSRHQWERIGFEVTREAQGEESGLMHLMRAFQQPKVLASEDDVPTIQVVPGLSRLTQDTSN